MRLRRACLPLAVSALLAACGPGFEVEANPPVMQGVCTLESRPSVRVTVVDARGHLQREARVTFTLDATPERPALCNGNHLRTDPPCDRWVASYEAPGLYVLTATSADGTRTARQEVTVGETSDGCHVVTEDVRLTLPD
jgi:hypothetical protein